MVPINLTCHIVYNICSLNISSIYTVWLVGQHIELTINLHSYRLYPVVSVRRLIVLNVDKLLTTEKITVV